MSAANPEQSIFLAALDLPTAAERATYLKGACGLDLALLANVQELLAAHEMGDDFLDRPLPNSTVDAHPVSERPGTVIGPYKLLEQIGEGGFGIVFMAEQQHPVRRKVALKVLKPGMDTRQVVARFEAERQALALMDHPHIAHIFDGGETASGRPYFVMELVRGIPLTDFCDQTHMGVRERLELYVTVCQAVQHAHQRGIIHRDLKPSNVLVTLHDDRPVVKIIDFGIAKATGQQLTEKTLFTNFAQMIGTPLYMSPEQTQLSGLDLDTRSDIYSLGVLLYELLTGTTPFDKERLRTAAYDEILRIIREEEPAKPSTRISTLGQAASAVSAKRKSDPRQLIQLCRGELDWIVMKALEKDRNRRYESASAFAADVQRYLDDEPVQACPPSAWYRFRKFARRHKRAVVMASFVFALLVIAVVVLGVSYAQVREALQDKSQALQREGEALQEKTQALQEKTQALDREQQTSYFQSIALAERQLSTGNVTRAEEVLNDCPAELRCWEWHFLKRQRYGNAPPLKHSDTVNIVAFNPDGRQIASGCRDGTMQIWDARTGSVLQTLQPKALIPRSPTYSSDGQYLAVADTNRVIRIWKTTTGELLPTLRGHQVAFSPVGRTLAASQDRSVMLWDLGAKDKSDAYRVIQMPPNHSGDAGVAFSPDGGHLLTACNNGTVKTWNVTTGQETFSFDAKLDSFGWACFSPDARRLGWTCAQGVIRVWDTATGREQFPPVQTHTHMTRSVAFSPDGRRIAVAGYDGTIRLLDGSTGRETLTIYAHLNFVDGVTFSPDGHRLASAGYDHTVRLWDATPLSLTGDPQAPHCVTLTAHKELVNQVAFSRDGRWLASASRDSTVKLWELLGERAPGPPVPGAPSAITHRYTLRGHRGSVIGVAFSSDNRTLASASSDNTVNLWDLQAPKGDSLTQLRTIIFTQPVFSIAFHPEGRLLAIGQLKGIAIYDSATGKEVCPFKSTPAPVPALAFGPDGRLFSVGASDPNLKIWDVAKKEPILTIPHHFIVSETVAVSPDRRLIASGGHVQSGHTVRIWDAQTGKELHQLKGHVGIVWTVAFSPDNRYLASGSWDSTVKVWDLAAPESVEPLTLPGHAGYVLSLAFSPDGRRLASSSGHAGNGEIKVWDATLWDDKAKQKR